MRRDSRLLVCLLCTLAPAAVAQTPERTEAPLEVKEHKAWLTALSDDRLIEAYLEAGTALRGTVLPPADRKAVGVAGFELRDPRHLRFQRVREEVVRRGAAWSPR